MARVTELLRGGSKTQKGSKTHSSLTAVCLLHPSRKAAYIPPFLHLEWIKKYPTPRQDFQALHDLSPEFLLNLSHPDLPIPHQNPRTKIIKHSPTSRSSHLLFSWPKCGTWDLHVSWSFSSYRSWVPPPLRPSLTTLTNTAWDAPSLLFLLRHLLSSKEYCLTDVSGNC